MNINLLDYFCSEELYVKTADKKIIKYLFEKTGYDFVTLGKKLKIKPRTLRSYKNYCHGLPFKTFCSLLTLSSLNIEDYVNSVYIKTGKGGKFPSIFLSLPVSPDLLYAIELIRTDGYISKNKITIGFTNKDESLINKFISFANSFGVSNIKVDKDKTGCYRARLFNIHIAEILVRIFNIKNGHKSLTTCLPAWMKNLNRECLSAMLRGSFDGDGTVQNSKRTKRIRLTTGSKKYAEDIKELLYKVGIESQIIRDPRECHKNVLYVQISRKENLEKFANLIGFNHKKRSGKLKELIESYKIYSTKEVENKILEIINSNNGVTGGYIAKQIKRAHSTVSSHLNRLESKGLIKKQKHKQMKRVTPCLEPI